MRVSIPLGAGFSASGGNCIFLFITNNLNNCNLHSVHLFCGVSWTPEICISKGPDADLWIFPGSALPCANFKRKTKTGRQGVLEMFYKVGNKSHQASDPFFVDEMEQNVSKELTVQKV